MCAVIRKWVVAPVIVVAMSTCQPSSRWQNIYIFTIADSAKYRPRVFARARIFHVCTTSVRRLVSDVGWVRDGNVRRKRRRVEGGGGGVKHGEHVIIAATWCSALWAHMFRPNIKPAETLVARSRCVWTKLKINMCEKGIRTEWVSECVFGGFHVYFSAYIHVTYDGSWSDYVVRVRRSDTLISC